MQNVQTQLSFSHHLIWKQPGKTKNRKKGPSHFIYETYETTSEQLFFCSYFRSFYSFSKKIVREVFSWQAASYAYIFQLPLPQKYFF